MSSVATSNWVLPDSVGVEAVLNGAIVSAADGLLQDMDTTRLEKLTAMVVAEVRGAIRRAGRSPLSLTAGLVPPEGERHVYALVVQSLVASKPTLAQVDKDNVLGKLFAAADKWLNETVREQPATPPTDPTGRDYLTAVDEDPDSDTYNPSVQSVRYGANSGRANLRTPPCYGSTFPSETLGQP